MMGFGRLALLFLTLLAVTPTAVFGQIQTLDSGDCGMLGISCTGGETPLTITARIDEVARAGMLMVGTVVIIFLIYAGYKYISSAGNEDAAAQAKRQIIYAGLGAVVVSSALLARHIIILTYQGNSGLAANEIRLIVSTYTSMALFLVGTAATIFLIYAGYKYINSQGDYESAAVAKRQIVYALMGIVLAAGANIIAEAFVNPAGGLVGLAGGPAAAQSGARLVAFVRGPINAMLVLVAIAALAYIMMAGFMYLSSQGDEGQAETAKQQLMYGVIGIIVILLSATLVNFFIRNVA